MPDRQASLGDELVDQFGVVNGGGERLGFVTPTIFSPSERWVFSAITDSTTSASSLKSRTRHGTVTSPAVSNGGSTEVAGDDVMHADTVGRHHRQRCLDASVTDRAGQLFEVAERAADVARVWGEVVEVDLDDRLGSGCGRGVAP